MPEKTPKPAAGESGGDFEARLRAARKRLDDEAPYEGSGRRDSGMGIGLGVAIRVATELVAAIAVGVGIGWALDAWLETKPWFLVAFTLLGGGAGVMNVFRLASNQGQAVGYRRPAAKDDGSPDGPDAESGGQLKH